MKDLSEVSSFPGIHFNRKNEEINMSQFMYLKIIFKKSDMGELQTQSNSI